MTTRLDKPVSRETTLNHRGRHLIVTLEPFDLVTVRQKGLRKGYTIPIAAVFDLAVKMTVAFDKAAKAKARKAKKESKR